MMTWSLEQKKEIAKYWNDGESASQVGARFGVSRNAIIGLKLRNPKLFTDRPQGAGGRRKRSEPIHSVAEEALRRRIANRQSRDQQSRERAIANASALRSGRAAPDASSPQQVDIESIFAVDPSSGTKGDLSRLRLADVPSVPFVDLATGRCRLTLIGFSEIAGPYSPCCGAPTGDPLKPWCPAHRAILRAA